MLYLYYISNLKTPNILNYLSARNRAPLIEQLKTQHFDLVVIGGGITGAGIALDAASRGMRVALVEMRDFASGTSSKSTKLIHGGLRYLKQFEIALVREVGRERAVVHRLAPHLVVAEKMLLPLIKGGTFGKVTTSLGLMVYDFLAEVHGDDKRQMLSKEETLQEEPLLRADILTGGGLYAEYRTDDARLTIELIKTAAQYGALSANYVCVEDFIYEDDMVQGVQCKDLLTDETFVIKANYLVSATGPWVDKLREKDNSLKGKHLFHSKGVHIVVPHERFPVKHSVYFDVEDGRMMFAIPRHRTTYIGTTDTPYEGDLNRVLGDKSDVDYILNATNHIFPDAKLTIEDVESSWAGLRPLIYEEGKSASEMSRKDELFESDSGLISIAGGKLTGYRKMAEKVVDLVSEKFQKKQQQEFDPCKTDKIPFSGGPFKNETEVFDYQSIIAKKLANIAKSDYYAMYLVANYGKQTDAILQAMDAFDNEAETNLIRAELSFGLENELIFTAMDFFNRRTGRLYFNIQSIETALDVVLADMKNYFDWSEQRMEQERQEVQQAIADVSTFQ